MKTDLHFKFQIANNLLTFTYGGHNQCGSPGFILSFQAFLAKGMSNTTPHSNVVDDGNLALHWMLPGIKWVVTSKKRRGSNLLEATKTWLDKIVVLHEQQCSLSMQI